MGSRKKERTGRIRGKIEVKILVKPMYAALREFTLTGFCAFRALKVGHCYSEGLETQMKSLIVSCEKHNGDSLHTLGRWVVC